MLIFCVKEAMTIGRKNKTFLAITCSAIMLLSAIAIALPYQEAEATHPKVKVTVIVIRSGTFVASYPVDDAGCGTTCATEHDLNIRDLKRWERWCPTDAIVVTISAGDSTDFETCQGKGPWSIRIFAQLGLGVDTHPSDVTTTVTVI